MKNAWKVLILLLVLVLLIGPATLPAFAREPQSWDGNYEDYPDLYPDHTVVVGQSGGFSSPVGQYTTAYGALPIPENITGSMAGLALGEVWTGRYVTYELAMDKDGYVLMYEADESGQMRLVGYEKDGIYYDLDRVTVVAALDAATWDHDYSGWVTATLYAQARPYVYEDPNEAGRMITTLLEPEADGQQYVYMTSHLGEFSFEDEEMFRGFITGDVNPATGGFYVDETGVGVFKDPANPNSHYVLWRVNVDDIIDQVGETTIRLWLGKKDNPAANVDPVNQLGQTFTSETTRAWFRPARDNGYYYTSQLRPSILPLVSFQPFSVNAGNNKGLDTSIFTDMTIDLEIRLPFSAYDNASDVRAFFEGTQTPNPAAVWRPAGMSNSGPKPADIGGNYVPRAFEYHLYWVRGQSNQGTAPYILTLREIGTGRIYEYTVRAQSGNTGIIIIDDITYWSMQTFAKPISLLDHHYYASTLAWGPLNTVPRYGTVENLEKWNGDGTSFPVVWNSGTIIQTMAGSLSMKLLANDPPTTDLTIHKSLTGHWRLDWEVTPDTLFGLRLQTQTGQYVIFNPVPDTVNEYTYGGTTAFLNNPQLNTLFFASENAPAVLRNVPVENVLSEEQILAGIQPTPYTYTVAETLAGPAWEGLQNWQQELVIPTLYDVDGETLEELRDEVRPDNDPVLPADKVLPNLQIGGLAEGVACEVTLENDFGHGVGFLRVYKFLTGYWDNLDVDGDTVFYVRIWDTEAENYLLFDPVPRMVGDMETLWCVGNHIVGLTEDYEQLLPNGDPRPQPIMELPFTYNDVLLLSNLWTWGRYEVHEVMPTDAALAPYLPRYSNPALLSPEWQAAVAELIADEWTATWEGIADADRDLDWAIRGGQIGAGNPPIWPAGEWMADDWVDKWASVHEIVDELAFGINTGLIFGVNYTESEQIEDGKLNFNEIVTWTASNKFKYPSTNIWIGKRLEGAHLDWGVGPNTWFYMQVWNVPDEEDSASDVQLIFERRRISGPRGYDYHVIGHMDQEGNEVFYWIEQAEDAHGILRPTPEEYYAAQYARNDIVTEVRVRSNLEQRVVGLPTEELFGRTFEGTNYVVREGLSTAAQQYVTISYDYKDGYDSPSTPAIIEDDLHVLVTNHYGRGNGTLATVTKWFPCGHGIYYGFCDYENHGIHSAACSADSNTKNAICENPHTYTVGGVEHECDTGGHYWCGGSSLHVKGEGDFATTSRENTWFLDGRVVDLDTDFYFTMSIWRWAEGMDPNEIEDGSYLPNARNPHWVNPNTLEPGWVWPQRDQKGYFIDDPQWGEWEVLEFVLEDGIYNRVADNIDTEAASEDPQFMGLPITYLPIAVGREVTLGNLGYQGNYKIEEYVATEYDLSGPIAFVPIETHQRIGTEPDDPNGLPWVSYEVRHSINFTLPEKYLTFYALEFAFGQENLESAGIGPEAYAELKPGDALTRAQATALMAGALSVTDFGVTGGVIIPVGWSTDIPWSVIATATSILREGIGITEGIYNSLGPGVRLFEDQANALIAMGVLSFEDVGIDGNTLTLPADWSPWAEGLPPYTHIVQGNRNVLDAYGVTAVRYAALEQELLDRIALGQSMGIDLETATGLMTAGVFTANDLRGMAPINLFNNFRPSAATLKVTKDVAEWPEHFTGTPSDEVYYFRVIDVTGSNRVLRWRTEPVAGTYFCLGNGIDHFADPAKFASHNYAGLFGVNNTGLYTGYTVIAIRDGQTIELQNLWGEREYRVEEMVLVDGNFVPATLENAGYTPSYGYGTIESELQSSTERVRPDLDNRALLINGDVQAVTLTNTYPPYYAVDYDANGGVWDTDPQPPTVHYQEGDTVTVAGAEPERDGYIFGGWNTAADGSGTDYAADDTFTMPDENVILYAQWEAIAYTVTYVNGGGSGGPFSDGTYTVESPPVTVLGVGATGISRTGYRFMGWATTDVAYPTDATVFQAGNTFAMPAKNVELTAQWSEEYRLYYNGNGNNFGTAPTDSGRYITGETATAAGRGALARTGWSFTGWNTAPDGSGTAYAAGATNVLFGTADITLYAQWSQIPYHVYYEGNGHTGGTPPATEEYFYDEEVTVRPPGNMVKENYRFVGWKRVVLGGDFLPGEIFDMPPVDVYLEAIWVPVGGITLAKELGGSFRDWGVGPNDQFRLQIWCNHLVAAAAGENPAVLQPRQLIFERTGAGGLVGAYSYRAIGYHKAGEEENNTYWYPLDNPDHPDTVFRGTLVDWIPIAALKPQLVTGIPVGDEHNYYIKEVGINLNMAERINITYRDGAGNPLYGNGAENGSIEASNTVQMLTAGQEEILTTTNDYRVGGGQAILQKVFSSGDFELESRPYTWPGNEGRDYTDDAGNLIEDWWNDTEYYATMAIWVWADGIDPDEDLELRDDGSGLMQLIGQSGVPEVEGSLGTRWYYVDDWPAVGRWEILQYTQPDPGNPYYLNVYNPPGISAMEDELENGEPTIVSYIPFSGRNAAYLNGMDVELSYKVSEFWGLAKEIDAPCRDLRCDISRYAGGDPEPHDMCFIPIQLLHNIVNPERQINPEAPDQIPWVDVWVEHTVNFNFPEENPRGPLANELWDNVPPMWADLVGEFEDEFGVMQQYNYQEKLEEWYNRLLPQLKAENPDMPDDAGAWYRSLDYKDPLTQYQGVVLIRSGIFSTNDLTGTAPVSIFNNFHAGWASLVVTKEITDKPDDYVAGTEYRVAIRDMTFDTRLLWIPDPYAPEGVTNAWRCVGNETDSFSESVDQIMQEGVQNYLVIREGDPPLILNNLWSNCEYEIVELNVAGEAFTPRISLAVRTDPAEPETELVAGNTVFLANGDVADVIINNIYPDEYTVTYESGVVGETITVPPTETVSIDTLYEVAEGPSRTGYTFKGWRNDWDGKLYQAPDGEDDAFLMPRTDVILTAVWEAIDYTVTYVDGSVGSNDVLPTDAAKYNIGNTVTVKDQGGLLRPGYTFLGWRSDIPDDTKTYLLGSADEDFTMPADNVILTAEWEAIDYTVTYVDGSVGSNNVLPTDAAKYNIGNTVTVKDQGGLLRPGYTFLGWRSDIPDDTKTYLLGSADEDFTMPADNVILTAVWEAIDYTVTYVDGSVGSNDVLPTDAAEYNIGNTVTVKDQGGLLRPGYTFLGWRSDIPDDTKTYLLGSADEDFTMPADNVILTAEWEAIGYTVTYDPGAPGGTPYDDGPYTVENEGENAVVVLGLADVGFTYPGYNFLGWTTMTEGVTYPDEAAYFEAGDTFDMPPRDVTLTAVWEFREGDLTVLKYLDEVGPDDGGEYPFWADPDNPYDFIFTVRDTGKDALLYFVQVISEPNTWIYVGDETMDEVPAGAATVIPFRGDLPAILKGLPADVEYEIAEDYDPDPEPHPHKDLVLFLPAYYYGGSTEWDDWDWFMFTMFEDSYDELLVNMEDKDDLTVTVFNSLRMVYAWLYTVTYDGNGSTDGAVPVDPATGGYTQDASVTVLGPETLQRDGYTFNGWNTEEDGSGTAYQPGDIFTMPPNNVILYAQWEQNEVPQPIVTFYWNYVREDDGIYLQVAVPAGSPVAEPEAPGRDGFIFAGWFLDEACTVRYGFTAPVLSDLDLYARWTVDVSIPLAPEHYAYMIGNDLGLIMPEGSITRAEVATIFFRLITDEFRGEMWAQENPYPDVSLNHWFNNAVSTMTNIGVFVGLPDGTFAPDTPITRAEFAAAVSRFFDIDYDGPNLFSDITGHWAEDEINKVGNIGWVLGVGDGSFEPDREITRAEAAALINRILERHLEAIDDMLPGMIIWPDHQDTEVWYYLDIQEASNSNEYERKPDGIHKYWTALIENRPWAALERPDSSPEHINTAFNG